MDYSSSIHDPENAAEASPWGNSPTSSPGPSRTAFGSITGDAPGSPFRYPPSSNGLNDDGGFGGSDIDYRRPGTASTVSQPTEREPEVSAAAESQPEEEHQDLAGDQGPLSPQLQQQQQQQQDQEQQEQQDQHQHQPRQPPKTTGSIDEAEERPQQQQQQQQPQKPPPPQFKLQAKITGLERTGRKDPILRFDVHTNLPTFRTTQYRDVRRLHSEFVKLAEHLLSANPDAIVPSVPPPLTSAGAGTEEDEIRVKALMQRWFNYVCSNEVLMRDDEMVLFVESDFGYSPMVKKKQPATGEARPIVKLFYLGAMDASHKVDKLVKSRRGLGLSELDFGVKLGSMHAQEPHPGLANAYRKLGKIIQTVGDYHAAQATAEATTLSDPLQYHSQDAFVVKETLTNRQILIREFLQAQEATRSRLNAADRLKASSNVRREKVDEAIASLEEARHNELALFEKTTRVTQNLVHERRRWFARTAADLRLSIREYVLRQIEAERRTLALLESARPDIRSIDSSGGLSRLGRESHPPHAVRRSGMAASQGPKGDAWSGVPRRSAEVLARSVSGTLVGSSVIEAAAAEDGAFADGGERGDLAGRARTLGGVAGVRMPGVLEEDDEDRVDARNAASRLATTTF
ncbi:hypothetical protein VTH06DRAFT_4098 [Thermothelomyces fergusii]